jgi:hypothetical protein
MSFVQRISEVYPLLDVWVCVRVIWRVSVEKSKVVSFANYTQIMTDLEDKKLRLSLGKVIGCLVIHNLEES